MRAQYCHAQYCHKEKHAHGCRIVSTPEGRPLPRPRRSTIDDIAARTGLSTATVSRAINNKPRISAATRDRILATLQEVGYVPSRLASGLRTGRTNLLGMVMKEPREPTEFAVMQGIVSTAPAPYGVVVYMLPRAREDRSVISQVIARGAVDGVLWLYPDRGDEPQVQLIRERGLPLVLVDPQTAMPHTACVFPDAYYDGYDNTRYLLALGHRRIAASADGLSWGQIAHFLDGYHAALADAGLPADPTLAVAGGWRFESGYATTRRWLHVPDRPTGMCFHSDIAAMGALAAARDEGLAVPQDLSIIGYDDTQLANWIKPALTTRRERRIGLARVACEVLLTLINGAEPPAEPVLVRTDLVPRQSTGIAMAVPE
jgi:LacI family transcriptional regulator